MARIGFIGGGKMAEALIARLGSPRNILVSDINQERLGYLKTKYRAKIAKSNREVFIKSNVVVLAVKPQQMAEVLGDIQKSKVARQARHPCHPERNRGIKRQKLKVIISIAAGIPLGYLERKLPGTSIIRAMPNNPCMAGKGVTALAKGKKVSTKQYAVGKRVFRSVGEVVSVPEKWMDAVTGLSGSGPAFVYLVIEALIKGGEVCGLPHKVAKKLALETVAGAAETVKKTGVHPRKLREMVTSPGGTTMEGLKVLEKRKTFQALVDAVRAAAKKSKKLSRKIRG